MKSRTTAIILAILLGGLGLLEGIYLALMPDHRFNARYNPGTDTPHPDTHVKCPDCAELVKREAKVCKHCGCRLIPQ